MLLARLQLAVSDSAERRGCGATGCQEKPITMNETPDTEQRPAQPVVATGPLLGRFVPRWLAACAGWSLGLCAHNDDPNVVFICVLLGVAVFALSFIEPNKVI